MWKTVWMICGKQETNVENFVETMWKASAAERTLSL